MPLHGTVDLASFPTWSAEAWSETKEAGKERVKALSRQLQDLQEVFYAGGAQRLLIVLQAMDTAGRPRATRSTAYASRKALAAAWFACPGEPSVPALVEYVVDRPRRTTLQRGEAVVETVEHCLSALAGMGVDNVIVELDGPEMPAVDGSAAPFVEMIRRAGVVELEAVRRPLVVSEPVSIREGDAMMSRLHPRLNA